MSDVIRLSKKKEHLSKYFTSTRKDQTNLKSMPPQTIFNEPAKPEDNLP